MIDTFQVLSILFGFLGGGGGFVTWMLYGKQTKRLKSAEAFEREVQALENTITVLKSQVDWMAERLEQVQNLVTSKEMFIGQLSKEKLTLELKNAKNKSAINKAYDCKQCDVTECPVLIQRKKNEDEYANLINKAHVDSISAENVY